MLNCCKDCALHEGHVSVNKFNVYNVAKMTRGKRILSIANAKMSEHMLPQCHKNEMCALYANFKLDGRQEIANKCEMSILVAYRIHKFFSDSVLCICVCICKSCELYGNFFFYCWFFLQMHTQIWARQSHASTSAAFFGSFSVFLLFELYYYDSERIESKIISAYNCSKSSFNAADRRTKQKHRTAQSLCIVCTSFSKAETSNTNGPQHTFQS